MKKVFDVADVRELATTKKEVDTKTCPICGKKFKGYGNNCTPLYFPEQCCDKCNIDVIVPISLFLDDKIYHRDSKH